MRAVDVIRAVRDQTPAAPLLSPADLRAFIQAVSQGDVPDYQTSAFLMAVCWRGLSALQTVALTEAMRDSGRCLRLQHIPGRKVDKHSTGGVGDKISLALAPWVAACGVPVPMVSGRGLGHTGGTLDKLAAIPGMRTDVDAAFFVDSVAHLGVCMMGQTADMTPADKKLYALRDVTATVESVALITASILSKKLAEGIDALLLDVKVGRGAFMKTLPEARQLAHSLLRVGQAAGLQMVAVLTNMDTPLGSSIGNALEVHEAFAILRGSGPPDTQALTLHLVAEMLVLGGRAAALAEAKQVALAHLHSGAALQKMRQLIAHQGGDASVVEAPERLPAARYQTPVYAAQDGFVVDVDPYRLAQVAMHLGAGRATAEASIDPATGITLTCRRGQAVQRHMPLACLHHNTPLQGAPHDLAAEVAESIQLGASAPPSQPLIIETIRGETITGETLPPASLLASA